MRILTHVFRLLVAIGMVVAWTPMQATAQGHEITYDRVIFERSTVADDRSWAQLRFRIEGFRIDGRCYRSCSIGFSLDGSIDGPAQQRADLRITDELVTSPFPGDRFGQMFIGNRTHRGDETAAIAAFRERERLALAWIVHHSTALIEFALDGNRIPVTIRPYWQEQTTRFERRLASVFSNVLSGYRDAIPQRNTREDLVTTIQPALAALGLYAGGIDGLQGPQTRNALRAFQSSEGRLATGYADSEERELLAQHLEEPPASEMLSHTERLALERGIELSQDEDTSLDTAAELTRLEAENARLQRSLELSQSIGASRSQTIRTLRSLLAEANAGADPDSTLRRQLDAANETIADLRDGSVPHEDYTELQLEMDAALQEAQRQLSAANETIADLREDSVPREDYAALEAEIEAERQEAQRQLNAANEALADLRESSVPLSDHQELRRQLDAANAANADLRAQSVPRADYEALITEMDSMVPAVRLEETERQLAAANETIADMHDTMVPIAQAAEIFRQLEAANQSVADLRADIAENYVDRGAAELREATLSRQISALNQTILELTEDRDRQRTLRRQTEQIYQNWVSDCRAQPVCASAMQLD